jgi:hypothetical protein
MLAIYVKNKNAKKNVFIFGQEILFVRNENQKRIAALPQSDPFFLGKILIFIIFFLLIASKSGFHLWKDKNLNSNKKIMLAIYVKNKNAKKNHLLRIPTSSMMD